jgi:predicted transposase/invertase (TIGR01784 family)
LGQHDASYKLFFSHPQMVRDLLREILSEAWVSLIDLSSAKQMPSKFITKYLKDRESDVIWRFRRKDNGETVYVYILLEFQSTPERYMAVRVMSYVGLFLQALIAGELLPPSGKLPLVIPIVLYNGIGPWREAQELSELIERLDPSTEIYVPRLRYRLIHEAQVPLDLLEASESPVADLFRLERSEDWEDILQGVPRLRRHVPPTEPLRLAFESWLNLVYFPRLGITFEKILTLEEMETMLPDRIETLNRRVRQQALQEGLQQGEAKALLHLLEKRFGSMGAGDRERISHADSELLLEWIVRAATAASLSDVFGTGPA